MKKVVFAVWHASGKDMKFLEKVEEYFISKLDVPVKVKVDDLKSIGSVVYGDDIEGVVVFGKTASNYCSFDSRILAPGVKEMLPDHEGFMANKKILLDTLELLAKNLNGPEELVVQACVETPEKVSVGLTGCDINITEAEAIHLKRIRDILGGGKMVITKGDLRIEVTE